MSLLVRGNCFVWIAYKNICKGSESMRLFCLQLIHNIHLEA